MTTEKKRKNPGNATIIIGFALFGTNILRMNFDNIRKNDIIILICLLIYISFGIYANVKSKNTYSKN